MIDDTVRTAERRFRRTRAPEDEARWYEARRRAGELPLARLRSAAWAGNEVAAGLVDLLDLPERVDLVGLIDELGRRDPHGVVGAFADHAEAVWLGAGTPAREQVERALEAVRAWCRRPDAATAAAAAEASPSGAPADFAVRLAALVARGPTVTWSSDPESDRRTTPARPGRRPPKAPWPRPGSAAGWRLELVDLLRQERPRAERDVVADVGSRLACLDPSVRPLPFPTSASVRRLLGERFVGSAPAAPPADPRGWLARRLWPAPAAAPGEPIEWGLCLEGGWVRGRRLITQAGRIFALGPGEAVSLLTRDDPPALLELLAGEARSCMPGELARLLAAVIEEEAVNEEDDLLWREHTRASPPPPCKWVVDRGELERLRPLLRPARDGTKIRFLTLRSDDDTPLRVTVHEVDLGEGRAAWTSQTACQELDRRVWS